MSHPSHPSQLGELAVELLLGSERRQPALPTVPGPVGELLALADEAGGAIETRVLRRAGVLATSGAAGYLPPKASQGPPAPCPPETCPPVTDPNLVAVLRQILDGAPDRLRAEAAALLARAGRTFPPRLLPRALDLGQRSPALRPCLSSVLGLRGAWLARQNASWAWASGEDSAQDSAPDLAPWEHGTLEQRKLFLANLRGRDAGSGRALLAEGFGQLDARERTTLLEQLENGLSLADEGFLEGLLGDRSKEVRQLAARLLAALPESRFVARMAARLEGCLTRTRKLFRQVLLLEPPSQFGSAWKDGGLEEARPKGESLGERAWWLYQIGRALPLSWWPAALGMAPAELIRWAGGTEWSEAILRAWGAALVRERDTQRDTEWAEAFLATPAREGLPDDFALLDLLPLERRERHWIRMLEARGPRVGLGELLAGILRTVPIGLGAPPASFARAALAQVRAVVATDAGRGDYTLRRVLPELVCLLPPDSLGEAALGWPAGRPDTEYFTETLAALLALVEQRKILHSTLRPRTAP